MVCDTMALTDHYCSWEDVVADRYISDRTIINFSNQNWMDVVDILRDLSVNLSCKIAQLKQVGKGNAYGTIIIDKGCISGEMRFDTRNPVLHEYTLEYEIPHSSSKLNAYFELTEEVLLSIDKSYIPPMIDYMLLKFPGSSITTRRINTFDYYTYAI